MMNVKDKLILDTGDDPGLVEVLSRKAPGDQLKVQLLVELDDVIEDVARFSVVDATVVEEAPEEEADEIAADEPSIMALGDYEED